MSTRRSTRLSTEADARRDQRPPSASPAGRSESKKKTAASGTKKKSATQPQMGGEASWALEDTEMRDANEGQPGVTVAPALTSTAASRALDMQTSALAALLVQQQEQMAAQQKQLALLTELQLQGASSRAAKPTGPLPRGSFDRRYKGEGGAALDDWISAAKRTRPLYSGMTEEHAVVWLAASLEGAALSWYESRFDAPHAPPASCAALFDELRKRFQPIDSEQTAMRDLHALKQLPKQSVDEYATRFLHLSSKVPAMPEPFAMFLFRQGLHRPVEDRINQAATQPATLQETIALAARIEGRGTAAQGSEQASSMETDAPSLVAQLAAMMDQKIEAAARSSRPQQPYDSRRNRNANKSSVPSWQLVQGLSKETADKRRAAGQCYHCGSGDHSLRDCKDRAAGKAPRLN
jgi:hypothetical protein